MNYIIEYQAYISPTRIVLRPDWLHKSKIRTILEVENEKNLNMNHTHSRLSRKTKMKVVNAVSWLAKSANSRWIYDETTGKSILHSIGFITLTIPYVDTLPSLKECTSTLLIPFLKSMRKYYGMSNYVWKAEATKKGMIHYHLTTDAYLPWKACRKIWNRLLEKGGFLDEWRKQSGKHMPNSVDCKKVKHVRNLAAYLGKYFSKNITLDEKNTGRIWGLSTSLSRALKTKTFILPEDIEAVVRKIDRYTTSQASYQGTDIHYIKAQYWNADTSSNISKKLSEVCATLNSG